MKHILFVILFLIIISSLFAWREAEMEVRVFYDDQFQLEQLHNFNLEGDIYPNGEALVYVIQSELDMIISSGLRYQIEKEDIQEFANSFWQNQDNTREAYHTWNEIIALADSLVGAFPAICQKVVYGTSMGGKELGALKISDNVSLDENEAEAMFDGGIHGDEIGGPENIIRFARDLCLVYGTDPEITFLIDNREIWLYYMVNPDGRAAMSRYNNNGVDLNRDASYMWDAWGGSPGPASQIESKALRDITFERNFVVHTTYHSGTEFISFPWSYRASLCQDYAHINQLAGVYSSTSGYANMPYGQGCTGMYPINGSTKDTNYGAMGSVSWSMEISNNKQPPSSQIMMYYNYNKPAMLAMIEYAGFGLEGIITDATTGEPVVANVFVNNYFPCYTDPAVGDYHKYVLPGTYSITIVANGYETQTITGITVTAGNSTITDFQLQPLDGQYVYKVRSSQIPDNNTADESDTPGVIGAPDERNYSIGKSGWIVLDMQNSIYDGPGNDLIVYEGDATPEGYSVFAGNTPDGPWISLGTGMGTTEFDLANGNMIDTQFIKILDDGDGSAIAANAGFDLDAVKSIADVAGVYIAFLGYELDEMIGNNNGYIDPGETMDMLVTLRNNGSLLAENTEGLLSTTSGFVTMNNGDVSFGNIAPGQEAFGMFTFTVAAATPIGELLSFDLDVTANAGTYTTNFEIACMVGIAIEDFETNNFDSFDWEFGGNSNWTTTTGAYEGTYCAKSGAINHSQTTSLMLNAEVVADGDISFQRKVSSETNYDYLRFYIDATQMGSWSGTSGWVEQTYAVSAGTHTFKWEYTKDGAVVGGSDCGWVDYIVFPPISVNVIDPGFISGTVALQGGNGNVEDVQISAGNNYTNPDAAGNYTLELFPGTYDVEATLEGYSVEVVEDVLVETGVTTGNIDFTLIGLDPPTNLQAEIIDYNSSILVYWSGAVRSQTKERDLLGYNIYFEGVFIAWTTDPEWIFEGPFGPEDYLIEIEAVYDEGVSEPAEITVTIVLNAPENLTAASSGNDIIVSWEAPQRELTEYNIYRDGTVFLGSTTETTFTDENVPSGDYTYGVSAIFSGGYESEISEVSINHTDAGSALIPAITELTQIYPNPFNPQTTVSFSLNQEADVNISIFNIKGQKVRTLVNDKLETGYHQVVWKGNDDNGKQVSSGVYFVTMDINHEDKDFTCCKKIILLK